MAMPAGDQQGIPGQQHPAEHAPPEGGAGLGAAQQQSTFHINCRYCNTLLEVNIPPPQRSKPVTVRCGSCNSLLLVTVHEDGAQQQPPQQQQHQQQPQMQLGPSPPMSQLPTLQYQPSPASATAEHQLHQQQQQEQQAQQMAQQTQHFAAQLAQQQNHHQHQAQQHAELLAAQQAQLLEQQKQLDLLTKAIAEQGNVQRTTIERATQAMQATLEEMLGGRGALGLAAGASAAAAQRPQEGATDDSNKRKRAADGKGRDKDKVRARVAYSIARGAAARSSRRRRSVVAPRRGPALGHRPPDACLRRAPLACYDGSGADAI